MIDQVLKLVHFILLVQVKESIELAKCRTNDFKVCCISVYTIFNFLYHGFMTLLHLIGSDKIIIWLLLVSVRLRSHSYSLMVG